VAAGLVVDEGQRRRDGAVRQAEGGGDDAAYTATRQFLVEHAAGDAYALAEACNEKRVPRVARYVPIPEGQSYRIGAGRWWWPCRVCGWAMDVRGSVVRCRYRYHQATYQVAEKCPARARSALENP
jgi:hypothetical protein